MKAANKQVGIPLPEIHPPHELQLVGQGPTRAPRWNLRLRAALAAAGWLLQAPALAREVAPGQKPLGEHEWRNRAREWIA